MPQNSQTPGGAEALSDLVTRCILAFEQGGEAAVEDLLADNKELADEARTQLLSLRDAGLLVPPARDPERLGPYRVLRRLGSGAVGSVYLAEQHEPILRRVAIKVIRPGMDSREVLARFAVERQALALLDHPNVASVLDAGVSDDGRPYLCMEYVPGLPITRYCDERRLDLRQRAELVAQVCEAVHAAHQKGILHRDLKPSNILVSDRDGKPWPTVIDFGVAKSLGPRLLDVTLLTAHGNLVGTPEYMSPEQAANEIDVDTRTDVHALGVLLYELLTGTLPIPSSRLRGGDIAQVLRIMQNETPPLPSTAVASQLATSPDTATALATDRNTSSASHVRSLKGELDWIVQQAIEKDRNRRYGMAADMGADLRRYLRHEMVQAGPQSLWYRWSKSLRRHSLQVGAGAAIMVALLGGLSTSLAFYAEASDKAEQSAVNLEVALAAVERMVTAGGRDLHVVPHMENVRRRLLAEALKLQEMLVANTSGTRLHLRTAHVLGTLGQVHAQLGQYKEALALNDEAQVLLDELGTPSSSSGDRLTQERLGVALLLNKARWSESLGATASQVDRMLRAASASAQVMMSSASTMQRRALAAKTWAQYGKFLSDSDTAAAAKLFGKARTALRPLLASEAADEGHSPSTFAILASHAQFYSATGDREQAVATATRLEDLLGKVLERTPDPIARMPYARAIEDLAQVWYDTEQFQRSASALDPVIELRRSLMRDFPSLPGHRSSLGSAIVNRSLAHRALDQFGKTTADLIEARDLFAQLIADYPTVALYHEQAAQISLHLVSHSLAQAQFGAQFDNELVTSAMQTYEESIEVLVAANARGVLTLRATGATLRGSVAERLKQPEQVLEAQREAVALYERLLANEPNLVESSVKLIDAQRRLATTLIRAGEHKEAEVLVNRALAARAAYLEQTEVSSTTMRWSRQLFMLKIQLDTANRNFAAVLDSMDTYLSLAPDQSQDWLGRKNIASAALLNARAATEHAAWRARFVDRIRSVLAQDLEPYTQGNGLNPMIALMRSNSLRILVTAEREFGEAAEAASVQAEVVSGYQIAFHKQGTKRARARLVRAMNQQAKLLAAAGDEDAAEQCRQELAALPQARDR